MILAMLKSGNFLSELIFFRGFKIDTFLSLFRAQIMLTEINQIGKLKKKSVQLYSFTTDIILPM